MAANAAEAKVLAEACKGEEMNFIRKAKILQVETGWTRAR
jgi:hypothetical protein